MCIKGQFHLVLESIAYIHYIIYIRYNLYVVGVSYAVLWVSVGCRFF